MFERLLDLWCVLPAVVECGLEVNIPRRYGSDCGAQGGVLSKRLLNLGLLLSAVEQRTLRGAESRLLSQRLLDVGCLLLGELKGCAPRLAEVGLVSEWLFDLGRLLPGQLSAR